MRNLPNPDPLAHLVEIRPDGTPVKPPEPSEFVNDSWIANQLQMQVSTVRSQRYRRRHGLDHWFEVDPVLIGSKPRYRRADVLNWLEGRSPQPAVGTGPASGSPDVEGWS